MGNSSNDMRRVQDRMDCYSIIIRDRQHVIREFYLDCVRDPAVRRWVSTNNKSDFRAVKNAKAFLSKMLVDFDGMMAGTFIRPSLRKATEPTKEIKLLPPPPVFNGQLPMATMLQQVEEFDWRSVTVVPMFPMDTTKSKDSLQSVIRTMFNEHLEAANAIKARIEDNESKKRDLEKILAEDREAHARTFVFLERLQAVDKGFKIMPNMGLKTSVFHVQPPPEEKREQKALPVPTPQRAKRSGKGLASELQLNILAVLRECPTESLAVATVRARLEAKGLDADPKKVASCLNASVINESVTLPVERAGFGLYKLKQPTMLTEAIQ